MIFRCTDYRRIKKFPDWRLLVSSEVYYLMEIKDGVDLGVWSLHPWKDGLMIHANLPYCSGKDVVESAKNAFKWIFINTSFKVIYAAIPNDKRHAQFIASWSGMEFQDTDEKKRYYKIESVIDTLEMAV